MFCENGAEYVLTKHAKSVDLYRGRFAGFLRTYRLSAAEAPVTVPGSFSLFATPDAH